MLLCPVFQSVAMFVFKCLHWFVFFSIGSVFALECGIHNGEARNDLVKITSSCVKKVKKDDTQNINSTEEYEDDYGSQSYDFNSQSNEHPMSGKEHTSKEEKIVNILKNTPKNNTSNATKVDTMKESDDNTTIVENHTEITDKCMVRCIFQHLNMLDGKGYPDHDRISQGLILHTENQQLKDFFQDSTDECFQLMEQGEDLDACDFATHFIKCLSEKGRSNCADWPLGDLPFSHVF